MVTGTYIFYVFYISQHITIHITGWWFGTWLLVFPFRFGIIIPIDFHIFQRVQTHQPDTWNMLETGSSTELTPKCHVIDFTVTKQNGFVRDVTQYPVIFGVLAASWWHDALICRISCEKSTDCSSTYEQWLIANEQNLDANHAYDEAFLIMSALYSIVQWSLPCKQYWSHWKCQFLLVCLL